MISGCFTEHEKIKKTGKIRHNNRFGFIKEWFKMNDYESSKIGNKSRDARPRISTFIPVIIVE
jgi:hypothetical protein